MKLKHTYIVGVHVMFYEVEMISEYIDSCIGMGNFIENKENIAFHFTWNTSEYFERIDTSKITLSELDDRFSTQINRLRDIGFTVIVDVKNNNTPVYNIADYRRDLNYHYCTKFDFILWGETDSLWPQETFEIIEQVNDYSSSQKINKYVLVFSDRKMWDESWKVVEHTDYTDVTFIDNNDWLLNNPSSSKSYMNLEEMYRINSKSKELDIRMLDTPKFDGSCLVIKSDLIKSGVNIPQSLLCSGEDTSFADIAKLLLGANFVQYVVKNIMRVHNRRHPNKRLFVLNENNPRGFCGKEDKGEWWDVLQKMSKNNLGSIRLQHQVYTMQDVFNSIKNA